MTNPFRFGRFRVDLEGTLFRSSMKLMIAATRGEPFHLAHRQNLASFEALRIHAACIRHGCL